VALHRVLDVGIDVAGVLLLPHVYPLALCIPQVPGARLSMWRARRRRLGMHNLFGGLPLRFARADGPPRNQRPNSG
jgi:hypothetical protein